MNRKQLTGAVILNGCVIVSVCVAIFYLSFSGYNGHGWDAAEETLRYFTNLSNIYCALVSLAAMICEIRMLRGRRTEIPHPLLVLKQTGTAAISLTMCTVIFFLAPAAGHLWYTCFSGYLFFVHFLNPLLAVICFVFLEKGKPLSLKENLFAVIPTVSYSAVYAVEVIALKNWNDFYGFTFGGQAWAPFVVIPAMACVTFLLSFLLSFAQKKRRK